MHKLEKYLRIISDAGLKVKTTASGEKQNLIYFKSECFIDNQKIDLNTINDIVRDGDDILICFND